MYESSNIAKNIKSTAAFRRIPLKTMLNDLGLNKNVMSNLYSGSMLKADSLARIADYLSCSVDALLGRAAVSAGSSEPNGITPSELAFLAKFRVLDPRGQSNVLAVLEHEYSLSAGEGPSPSVSHGA